MACVEFIWKHQFSASSSIIIIEDYYLQTFLHSLELSECHTLCHETGVYDSLPCPSPGTLDYQHKSIKIYTT